MIRILAMSAALVACAAIVPARAYSGEGYIGEGIQGRPHGTARVAVRNELYRHGFGYHRHPRSWYRRHY